MRQSLFGLGGYGDDDDEEEEQMPRDKLLYEVAAH